MTKRNIPNRGNSLNKGPQWERALLYLKNCRPGGHHGEWCEMKSQSGQAESRKACWELRVNTHGGHGNRRMTRLNYFSERAHTKAEC